jgi:hypothetical protein
LAPTCCHRCWKVGVEPVKVLEGRRRAGEVDPGEVGVVQEHLRDLDAVAREHVDDAGRHARLLEQLHGQVRGELLGRRGLPDHGVIA